MTYTRPTVDQIRTRMLQTFASKVGAASLSPAEHSVYGAILSAVAGGIHQLHGRIEHLGNQVFPAYADADGLPRLEAVRPISRKAASAAGGLVLPSGTEGVTLPSGTVLVRADGVTYTTQDDYDIPADPPNGEGVVVVCDTAGVTGNATGGGVLTLASPIAGVDSEVSIGADGVTGGEDAETDEAFRVRMIRHDQASADGIGNLLDIEQWAEEVSGVSRAWATRGAAGAGTVGLSFAIAGEDPIPSAAKIAEVKAYVEDASRLGGAGLVNMVQLEPVMLSLALFRSPMPSYSTRRLIETNLREQILEDVVPGGLMRASTIHAALNRSGVTFYTVDSVKINRDDGIGWIENGLNDIDLTGGEYISLTGITWSED